MVPIEQVKSDLREIRYYYSRKEQLEDASHSIGPLPIKRILENYNCAIRKAPLSEFEAGMRSGYLQCQSDHAGIYKYKKALAEGKSKQEARELSRRKWKK